MWIYLNRYIKKVFSGRGQQNHDVHHINIPKQIYNKLCDKNSEDNYLQFVVYRDQKTNLELIAICNSKTISDLQQIIKD